MNFSNPFSNPLIREHLVSAVITFVSVFLTALAVNVGQFTPAMIGNGALVALLLTAVRGAFKIAVQQFITS